MRSVKTVFFLGLLVAAMPFLGLPDNWKNSMYVIVGLILAGMAFSAYLRIRSAPPVNSNTTNVVVNNIQSVQSQTSHE